MHDHPISRSTTWKRADGCADGVIVLRNNLLLYQSTINIAGFQSSRVNILAFVHSFLNKANTRYELQRAEAMHAKFNKLPILSIFTDIAVSRLEEAEKEALPS